MSSLKQVILQAITKVCADPTYVGREYKTSDEARADFSAALIAELFPETPEMPIVVAVPTVSETTTEPKKEEKKKPGPKAKAKPKKDAEAEAEEKPKEDAEAPKKEEKKKPGPKPKPKPEGPVNLEKLNPTQTKKLKAASEAAHKETDKKEFLEHLNAMTPESYAARNFEEHVQFFLNPAPPPAEPDGYANCEMIEMEFEGETILIDVESKKVYREEGPVTVHIGDVGVAKFATLEIPAV